MVELFCVGGAIFAIFCYGYLLDKKIVKNPIASQDDSNASEV